MKKIILFAGLLFAGLTQAQDLISVTTYNGAPIEDGQVFTYDVLYNVNVSAHAAKLPILVTNISDEDINLKIKVESITNNAEVDNNVQLCFNTLCYNQISAGSAYPNNIVTLSPGESNAPEDHFLNSYAGDIAGQPVIYVLKIVQYDDSANEIATLRTFTYKYDSTMGVNDLASLSNIGITVNNTLVKDMLNVNAGQPATMEVYGLTGNLLKTVAVAEGAQAVDLSGLSAAVYIAKFTNNENQSSSVRIVKQ